MLHRQIVLTIPKRLRIFFKLDRRLLGDLCRAALRALNRYFEIATGSALRSGVIAVPQTFGDRINLHVHLHFLVTEGGVDETRVLHKISWIDDSRLASLQLLAWAQTKPRAEESGEYCLIL
ncbi:MAG: transposase [Candidatus Methanosuratincola sp.]